MKKFIFYFFFGTMFLFSGCSKEDTLDLHDQNSISQVTIDNPTYKKLGDQKLTSLYTYSGGWYWDPSCNCMVPAFQYMYCLWPPTNCLSTVTINAYKSCQEDLSSYVDEFIEHYLSSSIPNYFNNSENYKILFPYIDTIPGIVDEIIAGEIFFHKYFNAEYDRTDYYIGIPYEIGFDGNWEEWSGDVRVVLRIKDERE